MTEITTRPANAESHGIEIFSAPSDAPRVRWRTDLVAAGMSSVLLFVLILIAGDGSTLDTNTLTFIGALPGWLSWLGQAAYAIGVIYAFGVLIGVGLLSRRRLELLRDMLLAAVLAAAGSVLLTQLIDDRWPELAMFDLNRTRTTFPAFFVTTSTAIQAAASPHFTAPMRKIGWTFVLAAIASSVIGGVTTLSDALGGLLVGLIGAALVRYVFGTSAGLPSTSRMRAGLADIGVQVDELRYSHRQPQTSVVLLGTSVGDTPLFVNALGRDAWSSRNWTRLWRRAWYQDQGSQWGSDRRQQIEHEALSMLLARQGGAPVPSLVTIGMTGNDDALLVAERLDHLLADVDEVDDELLDAVWDALGRLHQAGISHGSIDASGTPALMGFADAAINPTADQLHSDVAALLTLTATLVGVERAIGAARRTRGDDDLVATLPLLQTASLNGQLRHRVKQDKLKIKDLRAQTADAIGTKVPELEQLTRVSWKSVLMIGFLGLAVYTIVAQLADVGFDTIWNTLSDARWSLILLGLVFAAATNYTDAIALAAVSPKPVPVGITSIEQFAIGFINIAVPSSAGRIATNARYFQKFGISPVTSTTTGAITGFIAFVAQAILVAVTILVGAGSIDLSQMQGGGGALRLLGLAAVIFVVALTVVVAVPAWRDWAWSKIRTPISQMRDALQAVRNPKVAMTALGSSIGSEVLYGAGFVMCVLAVGGSVSLGQAIFINVTVSLFAGLMPVPGGVGVAEAGMTAGLTAIGVDSTVAVSAVLIYRLISYYLPPLWGYVSLRWLTHHDYL